MLQLNYNPFPDLVSERLLFRKLKETDSKDVFRLRSNPERMKYIPRPILESEEQALDMILMMNARLEENTDINWAVCEKETGNFIGFMGFYRTQPENYRTEIGYMVLPEFERKGYVTEAVATMIDYAFKIQNFHSIEAVIDPENTASARILEKNGFKKEGHFRENSYFGGKFWDAVHYGLLKNEYISEK